MCAPLPSGGDTVSKTKAECHRILSATVRWE